VVTITPDQALIASHETGDGINTAFVDRVMKTINSPARPRPFAMFTTWRHMHRLAFAIMAIAALALVSGTAYAAYQLWLKPHAQVQHFGQNQYGRNEALVTFQNCKDSASTTYEVKSSSQLTAEQLSQLLQAKCEMDAITAWANAQEPSGLHAITALYPGAFTVESINGDTYELHGKLEDRTVTITKDTAFIVHGMQVGREAIHVGDTVGYVEKNSYAPGGGWPTERKSIAIVALELPAKMYEIDLQNQVAKRQDCHGNPGESCVNSGSIDVFPRYGEDNTAPTDSGDMFEIQGRIVEHQGTTVKVKASSGAIYTITAPIDIIASFNTKASANYNGITIENGDMLSVRYSQNPWNDHKTIQPRQVQSVSLLIELVKKTDPIKKY
jgi:hypothetical protein